MDNQGKGGCGALIFLAIIICGIAGIFNSCSGPGDSDFIDKAHSAVLSELKSPSTANWCNDDSVGDSPGGNEGDKIVTGCVNAQNSFGAIVEIDYAVYEDKDTNVLNVDAQQKQ